MLPQKARRNLGVMAMKGYSVFPKAPVLLKTDHQSVKCITPSAEMQWVYSAAPADWANHDEDWIFGYHQYLYIL